MRVVLGHVASIRLRPIALLIFSIVLLISSTGLILTGVFNQVAHAAGSEPTCSGGEVTGGGVQTTFDIKLTCSNLSAISYDYDASRISLVNGGSSYAPKDLPTISGNELLLTFYTADGSRVRDIHFSQGVLLNELGESNIEFTVPTDNIIDNADPEANNKKYSANFGYQLSVSAEQGLLIDNKDGETWVKDATVVAGPTSGVLNLNLDGSFTYMPANDYAGSDSFDYSVSDEAGNTDTATVTLTDDEPTITIESRRDNPLAYLDPDNYEDPNFAKVGDRIRVDCVTNEPVVVDEVIIAGYVATLEITDSTHFSFYYIMQEGDDEGIVVYSVSIHDSVDKPVTSSNLDSQLGVYFDKTKPVIILDGDDRIDLEINDSYDGTASATDDHDGQATVDADTTVDTSVAGIYVITYTAVDSAGNQADPVTRTVVVTDSIADDFRGISDALRLLGLENNLNTATVYNYTNFSGLYIERSINGVKFGRIMFNNEINLGDPNIRNFLAELAERMTSDRIGVIGFDVSDMDNVADYFDNNITIKFYNLNKLGFNNSSTLNDLFSKLDVYDDNGDKVDESGFDKKDGVYVGCNNNQIECYTFTLKINHFSKYVINKITYHKNEVIGIVSDQNQSSSILNSGISLAVSGGEQGDYIFQTDQAETLGVQTSSDGTNPDTSKNANKDAKAKSDNKVVSGLMAQWWLTTLIAIGLLYWAILAFVDWRKKNG